MKKLKLMLPLSVFLGGLLFGTFLFFPWNTLKTKLETQVQMMTGMTMSISSLKAGTAIQLGLKYGSLLGINAYDVVLVNPQNGMTVNCNQLTLAPKVWPIIMGEAQIGMRCSNNENGVLNALVKASPVWAVDTVNASVELDNLSLYFVPSNISIPTGQMGNISIDGGVKGAFTGTILINDFKPQSNLMGSVSWDLQGAAVTTPSLKTIFVSLPNLDLGNLKIVGSLNGGNISIPTFSFGTDNSLLQANMVIDLQSNPSMQVPVGNISGWLRVDPNAEKGELKDVPFAMFGKANDQGRREFVKKLDGTPQSILLPPQ